MRYEIKGTPFPVVICQLENGEQMVTERGSMVWMSPNMEIDVYKRQLPYTVTASFRIPTGFPFHLLLSRHLCATTLYFSRQWDYITFCRIVNPL